MLHIALIIASFFTALPAWALCMRDCSSTTKPLSWPRAYRPYTSQAEMREQSHNMRDAKNSVLGDVNIHVGHKQLDLRTEGASHGNTIDASVNSTIILGDMKK